MEPNQQMSIIYDLLQTCVNGIQYNFSVSQINEICTLFIQTQTNRPFLERFDRDCYIIGDVHGQFHDISNYMKTFGLPPQASYVFLGDYVDRGIQSLETYLFVLLLKICFPQNVVVLRGNHETRVICGVVSTYATLFQEIKDRYQQDHQPVFDTIATTFDYLSFACVIQKKILCVHGALTAAIKSLDEISSITLPFILADNVYENLQFQQYVASCFLWSDPVSDLDSTSLPVSQRVINELQFRCFDNTRRSFGELLQETAICAFLDANGLDILVRGHESPEDGFMIGHSGRVWTVFGATNYQRKQDSRQGACVLQVQNLVLDMHVFRSDWV